MIPPEPLRVVAVIAAFNEGPHIREVCSDAPGRRRVIVVDDGSPTTRRQQAQAAGAEVVRHRATAAGRRRAERLLRARGRGFSHVLLMDGDLQHRPRTPRLVAAAAGNADVMRGRSFDRAQMPASRYWSNVIGSWAPAARRNPNPGHAIRLPADPAGGLEPLTLTSTGYEIERDDPGSRAARRWSARSPWRRLRRRPQRSGPVRDTTRTCFLAHYRSLP